MTRISPARIALYVISALVLVYLILPVLIIAPISFSSARFLTFPPPSFSLRWYQQYFANPAWMQATRVTLTVAFLTVLIATPCGVAAAYAISQSKLRIMRVIHMALLLPLVVPIIITAVGIFFVYAKVGLVATLPGLVLANVMLGLPYVVISVLAGMQSFDPAQEMVARSLGMNRLRSFFAVTLPQIKSSVVAGGIFAFISAMDETIVALFISGGQYQPLTKRMFTALRDEIDPTIAAISTLMTAASFMLVLRRARGRRGAGEGLLVDRGVAKRRSSTVTETVVLEPIGRGVLDAPPSRGMTANAWRLVRSLTPAVAVAASSLRPQPRQNHLHDLAPALRQHPGLAEVAVEQRAERVAVGDAEEAVGGDGQMQIDGVDVVAEGAFRAAALQNAVERCDHAGVELAQLQILLQVLAVVDVLD